MSSLSYRMMCFENRGLP